MESILFVFSDTHCKIKWSQNAIISLIMLNLIRWWILSTQYDDTAAAASTVCAASAPEEEAGCRSCGHSPRQFRIFVVIPGNAHQRAAIGRIGDVGRSHVETVSSSHHQAVRKHFATARWSHPRSCYRASGKFQSIHSSNWINQFRFFVNLDRWVW